MKNKKKRSKKGILSSKEAGMLLDPEKETRLVLWMTVYFERHLARPRLQRLTQTTQSDAVPLKRAFSIF
jgi:hypothetical protein